MIEKILKEILIHHRGKFFGIIAGLVFSILVISVGLLETVFISVCVYIGFVVGKRVDENESFYSLIDRVFKEKH